MNLSLAGGLKLTSAKMTEKNKTKQKKHGWKSSKWPNDETAEDSKTVPKSKAAFTRENQEIKKKGNLILYVNI